ncbi:hypothetical protein JCM19298_3005 [Nonlabens ulvanivorans]|nr:hypothetical protein JCM19297_2788 [Nonlabens ulvanivorans]GAK92517.1 hypothetical protein JCM19298_3005 [Nonlabens ulvanivorans]
MKLENIMAKDRTLFMDVFLVLKDKQGGFYNSDSNIFLP